MKNQKVLKTNVKKDVKNPPTEEQSQMLFPTLDKSAYADCMFCLSLFSDSLEVVKRSINEKCPNCKEFALVRHLKKEQIDGLGII